MKGEWRSLAGYGRARIGPRARREGYLAVLDRVSKLEFQLLHPAANRRTRRKTVKTLPIE